MCSIFLLFSHRAVPNSFEIPGTLAHQAPLSMGFSKQGYWSRLSFTSVGDISDARDRPHGSCIAGGFFTADHLGSPVAEPKIFHKLSYSFCKRTSKPQKPEPNETAIPRVM